MGTVWGRRQLVAIYNAMNARANNDPSEFHHIPAAYRALTKDGFPSYYTLTTADPVILADRRPWIHQTTSGQRFDYEGRLVPSRPILFSRFKTGEGREASRCPFAIDALLETAAVAEEFSTLNALVAGLPEEVRGVEEAMVGRELLDRMFNPALAKYAVAAHAVANAIGVADVATAFRLAAPLATLCLNLRDDAFDNLRLPPALADWERTVHRLYLAERDRGYAFVVLAHHGIGQATEDAATWVAGCARAAGLGELSALRDAALAEFESPPPFVVDGPFGGRLLHVLAIGQEIFIRRGVLGAQMTVPAALAGAAELLPPILLGDDSILPYGTYATEHGVERLRERIDVFWSIERKMREFTEACGI